VGEEWRLLIELDADGELAPAAKELIAELGPLIGLHRADEGLVAYSDTAAGAAGAEHQLRSELERRALGHLESRIEHWDHEKQKWTTESGSSPEPTDEDEPGSGDDVDDDDLDEMPPPSSWTVAVSLSHHREARRLVEELKAEGWNASSSWHMVEVKTRSHDDAQTLVTELELRAPGAEPYIAAE
jgi:hypothetical protein